VIRINRTGAAHSGLVEWLAQRITAVYMALFLVFCLFSINAGPNTGFEQWSDWFNANPVRWGWMLFYVSALWHSWIGLRSVFLDYIKPFWLRLTLTLTTAVALFVHGMWVVDILYISSPGGGV